MSQVEYKKKDFEKRAQEALMKKDYANAYWNTGKAAEYGLMLAQKCEGKLAKAYLNDAINLISIAEELKAQVTDNSKVTNKIENKSESDDGGEKSEFQLVEKPETRLRDVIGLADVKEIINDKAILPQLHPEKYKRFKVKEGATILLYGPPGNGKTFIAEAIAGELDAVFFPVQMSKIKDKYVGETERNIAKLFDEVHEVSRAVLFLDEMDSYLSKRGASKNLVVNEFLQHLDGMLKKEQEMLLVLGATNRPWALDEAVMRSGRFDEKIYVGLPDSEARAGIVKLNVADLPVSDDINYSEIAQLTEGYSGADMSLISNKAQQSALKRQIKSNKDEFISQEDFLYAIKMTKSTVEESTISRLLEWQNK